MEHQNNELAHYGILGMKWGVRRYQNPDGSLTEEGKARQKRWKGPDTPRYRRLNKKADKGDRLRAEGKTITGINNKGTALAVGTAVAGSIAASSLRGKKICLTYGGTSIGSINSDKIAIGTAALDLAIKAKAGIDASNIRASYRRESNGEYWAG